MGKIHVSHRLITRNSEGKIIKDEQFESFATGEPAFRIAAAAVPDGCELTLQHGARVIFTAQG